MNRVYLLLLSFFLYSSLVRGQTMSPSAFLGYELGSNFTYHHRVMDYVRYLGEAHNDQIKIVEYGESYEGRPLVVAILGSPENIKRLEEIRLNRLTRIGLANTEGKSAPNPAVAWLSYNVHGDEGVSSEAAMEVMYELVAGDQRKRLDDLIVIVDPCLNPDGHARYVNWYNQMKGTHPNPSLIARERNQPWPGGRFNHYLFDLNRDWAWQVQRESRQRGLLYHQWMPHLHADFHEMGDRSSYYFPPASRPFHEEVTAWQRELNTLLGEYNRKYFDRKGWLYFTKTSYDLFYPSYGDTWPTFNGAIGITYEQGGGRRAGLAMARPGQGDTLTLRTRIAHHVVASKATLEALADNKARVIDGFEAYFKKARENPAGNYKSYLVKADGRPERLKPLESFLRSQQIAYGSVGEAFTAQAENLSSGKREKISFDVDDLLISAYQPQSHLLKILLETEPILEDSLTYDITSWGLSYVFGLSVYGIDQKRMPVERKPDGKTVNRAVAGAYAYLVNWGSTQSLYFLSDVLARGLRVRTADAPFQIEGKLFGAGSLILTGAGNESFGKRFESIVVQLADKHKVNLVPVFTGMVTNGQDLGADPVQLLQPLRVALLSGTGVSPTAFGAIWYFLDVEIGYPVTVVDKDNVNEETMRQCDVLILADGNYAAILKDEQLTVLSQWVKQGGKLIAMQGAVDGLVDKKEFAIKRKPLGKVEPSKAFLPYASRSREAIRTQSAGGVFEVTLDTTHPLAFGYAQRPYYASISDLYDLDYLSEGWNVGRLGDEAYRSGFVGEKAKPRLRNTLIFGVQELGKGKVIYMADHPLFRGFWENGKLLFGNALFR
jgi:hypothetical protein